MNFDIRRCRHIGMTLSLALVLSACAGAIDDAKLMMTSGEGMSEAELTLLEEAKRHAQTRLVGGASGAALGCLSGYIAGKELTGSREGTAVATTAGCAAGAFLGYAAGNYIAEVNRNAASQQADLRSRIKAAGEDTARYNAAADAASQTVDSLKRDIDRLNAQTSQTQATSVAYASEIKRLETSALSMRALILESQGNVQAMEKDIALLAEYDKDTSQLERELAKLKGENARLVASYEDLIAVAETIPESAGVPAV